MVLRVRVTVTGVYFRKQLGLNPGNDAAVCNYAHRLKSMGERNPVVPWPLDCQSMSSSTGQWSEPNISLCMAAPLIRFLKLSETRK